MVERAPASLGKLDAENAETTAEEEWRVVAVRRMVEHKRNIVVVVVEQ